MAIRFNPWDEEDDYLGGAFGMAPMPAPSPATPPPSAPPVVAQQPKPKSALDQLSELQGKRPMQSDPLLKPKPIERVLGGLAGAAAGFGAGYLNTGRRGPVVDPNIGANIGGAIVNRKFNNANRDFGQKEEALTKQAGIESQVQKNQRDEAYNQARIASENAQQGYAEAHTAALSKPKPIDAPKETPALAFERRKTEAASLGLKEGTPEYQSYVGSGRVMRPATEPKKEKTLAERNAEYQAEGQRLGLKGDDLLYYTANGRVPPKKAPKVASAKPTAAAAPTPDGPLSRTAQGVLDGKVIYHRLPAKAKDAVRNELLAKVPDWSEPNVDTVGERDRSAQAAGAIESLRELGSVLKENEQHVGPIAGLAAYIPGTEARKVQARIDLIKQRVGKALEGGVLRKEDEEKYKKILATIQDTPGVAASKIEGIVEELQRDLRLGQEQRNRSGRNQPSGARTSSTPKKVGDTFTQNGKTYRIQAINGDDVDAVEVKQ